MVNKSEKKILDLIITVPIVFFIIISFVATGTYYYQEQKEFNESMEELKINHIKSQKELIKVETQRAIKMIEEAKITIKEYKLDKNLVQKRLLNKISKVRFGKNGYFFIYDYNGVNLMHPIKPQLVGKNLYNLKDKNGVLLIQELIDSAKSGGKYVSFIWDNPKTKKPEDKIGYALGVQDWGWMIGTGVYSGDIKDEIRLKALEKKEQIKELIFSILSVVSIIAIIMSFLLYGLLKKVKDNILNYHNNLEIQTEKALAASKAKSEFLANMSHEIRTPLNAIVGFVDILRENETDKEKLNQLSIIDKSSRSLVTIINEILDFSKLQSGKTEVEKIDFDTFEEFEAIGRLFKAKCSEKDIILNINIAENTPKYLNSDIQKIIQVIANLISNAIKFSPNGKRIELKIYYNFDTKRLYVSVIDEGIGIPQDKQAAIFNAFSQADSSTTRKYGGTGLGLSISSSFIKLLGGVLELESVEDFGSRFHFSIPVEIGKPIEKIVSNNTNKDIENKKILLVEDNKANQMFMKVILKKMKLKFDIASDGVEAVENFKTNQYDCILMDENMPNMNGIEATKHILEYEKQNSLTHTPIIALTANALKGDRERFLAAGMDEYLTKPLNKKKLSEVLGKFLKGIDNVTK